VFLPVEKGIRGRIQGEEEDEKKKVNPKFGSSGGCLGRLSKLKKEVGRGERVEKGEEITRK